MSQTKTARYAANFPSACEMPESPIRKLFPLAEAAKARGVKVYHLNIGQPDLPTPQVGLDALKQVDRTVLEYSPSDGYRSLREKLVEYYAQYQIRLTADDIIVTTGGSEAVLFAFMSCLNPATRSSCPNRPTPTTWLSPYRRCRDPADHRLDRGRLRAAVGREVRGAYQRPHARHPDLQPNNPTGTSIRAAR